ncbi:hypothetical protein PF005_g24845 [Phytophthora fragariae]|uniref:Uncharacterized protein n=1 Tax=Phytophthora fragariae TaxID=53985 RepID=A0A6A3WVP7_9STRA|nr:hypothetical protein PF011_g27191 [Phytophthora fragariae]KAE9176626.1 hypothetical protein PF005_g24845 [Phytophthora fragariae]KAE9190176.1 hypothetical protein PF002_g24837 [Phytophthora fragariae]
MKLDLKERDLFKEDEIKQKKLRKQIEKDNTGLEGRCRFRSLYPRRVYALHVLFVT